MRFDREMLADGKERISIKMQLTVKLVDCDDIEIVEVKIDDIMRKIADTILGMDCEIDYTEFDSLMHAYSKTIILKLISLKLLQ